MERYAPNAMELASRDVVSRSEQTEIDEGRGVNGSVLLDLTPPRRREDHRRACPARASWRWSTPASTRSTSRSPSGRAPTTTWAASRPTTGGLTELEGLYAAGEVACVSVHGANRLGGNSLMETITFGRRAGRAAAEWALANTTVDGAGRRVARRRARAEGAARPHRRASGRGRSATSSAQTMLENFGVFRREEQMQRQIEIIDGLRERYETRRRRGQGRRLQHRPDPGARARLPARPRRLHARRPGSRARRAAARTRARTTTRTRDDENFLKHSITRWDDGDPQLDVQARPMTKWTSAGAEVLRADWRGRSDVDAGRR